MSGLIKECWCKGMAAIPNSHKCNDYKVPLPSATNSNAVNVQLGILSELTNKNNELRLEVDRLNAIIERGNEIRNNWANNEYQEASHYTWLDDKMDVLETKNTAVIQYCLPHVETMWAATIISRILDCDFRDAKQEAEKYLEKQK